jgi:acyl-CoA synthetase (AMP-forming)/AMP-acid ligase II
MAGPHLRCGHAVILGPQAEVHLRVGQGGVELLLRLRERVGVGGGLTSPDLFRQTQMIGEREYLGFVEVGDGLEVSRPIPLLHEEPLIVFDEVRRSANCELETIGVVVLHHRPRSLLEVLEEPAETAAILRDGWLWTGDLAYRDGDGFFFHRGRAKEILKIGGHRVSPVEIEQVVARHPGVAEAAVFGVNDRLMGEVPFAVVGPRSGASPSEADLIQFCRERLPAHQVPVTFVLVEALPRNESGKLLRAELAARYGSGPVPATQPSEPVVWPTLHSRSARNETQSE